MSNRQYIERNSSIELFRILATFLVLIVHYNGWFVNDTGYFDGGGIIQIINLLIRSASCVCVNSFILLSGYFGLKFSCKKVVNIWSVLVWIYVPFYLFEVLVLGAEFGEKTICRKIFALGQESYFVQCYLMLMFISPVINAFIDRYSKGVLKYVVCFVLVGFVFDCLFHNLCLGFGGGYMLTHFIMMYLVGRMVFLYKEQLLAKPRWMYIIGYVGCVLCMFFLRYFHVSWVSNYTNIFNILATICLLVPFLYSSFHSKFINTVAASTLTVYLTHVCPPLIQFLIDIDKALLLNHSYGIYLLSQIGVLGGVFVLGILYDKLRVLIFVPIVDKVFDKCASKMKLKIIE